MAAEPWTSVIAIDPGERVGWATARMRTNKFELEEHAVLPLKEFGLMLHNEQTYQGDTAYDTLVYETWRARPQNGSMNWIKGNDMQPSQVIGMIRLVGWLSGATLKSYPPKAKMVAQATMPQWLQDRKAQSNEEHDKDALDLLWHHYFSLYHDPSA